MGSIMQLGSHSAQTRESIKEEAAALHGIVLFLQSDRYNDYDDNTDCSAPPGLQSFPRQLLSQVRPSPM